MCVHPIVYNIIVRRLWHTLTVHCLVVHARSDHKLSHGAVSGVLWRVSVLDFRILHGVVSGHIIDASISESAARCLFILHLQPFAHLDGSGSHCRASSLQACKLSYMDIANTSYKLRMQPVRRARSHQTPTACTERGSLLPNSI
jgi:hypothetical protein